MASSGVSSRSRLLTTGGILSKVAGIAQVICSGLMIENFFSNVEILNNWRLLNALFLPGLPDAWSRYVLQYAMYGSGPIRFPIILPIQWVIIGGCLGVLGIVAVIGGVSAIRRKSVGLSLTGAICALPSVLLGLLAVIFVSVSKREFGASEVNVK